MEKKTKSHVKINTLEYKQKYEKNSLTKIEYA